MKFIEWRWKKGLTQLLAAMRPGPEPQTRRIVGVQLHIVLPAKAGVIAIVLYYLFCSGWLPAVTTTRGVVLETLQRYFLVYTLCNAFAAIVLVRWRRFPPAIFQWLVFTLGLLDGLFVAGLALITVPGGFESTAYWVFPGLIVLNALSIPLATPQIVLNVLLSVFYLSAGILNTNIEEAQINLLFSPGRRTPRPLIPSSSTNQSINLTNRTNPSPDLLRRTHRPIRWDDSGSMLLWREENATEPFLLRLILLWLLTACCYGVQALVERQRAAMEEAQEFELRERQLRSAGRLAAEFAHRIKNPLAIINNAAFSIQRALKEGRKDVAKQIEIIQEEVERSDRIVTQIMGYAQLTEGRVEKLNVTEELDSAIEQVFPAAASYGIQVVRDYESPLPPLLMQRRHLLEILLNLLQNARETLNGSGKVSVTARCRPDYSVEIIISDNGPGIPPEKLDRIFEAYYTTKEKGTGLGLAIVKHNVELYAGTVRVESELGKSARFILQFPAKAVIRPAKPT